MDNQENRVYDKLVCLKENHKELIISIVMDDQVPFQERFLYSKCLENHQSGYTKIMPVNSAIAAIKGRISKKYREQEKQLETSLKTIKQFCQKIRDLQNKVIQLFNEIQQISQLWITDQENLKQKDDLVSILQEFELPTQKMEDIKKINEKYFIKIASIYKKLLNFKDYEDCYNKLKQSLSFENFIEYQEQDDKESETPRVSQVQLVQSVQQNEWSGAMAFNQTGTIMVSACDSDLKVWKFENQKLSQLMLLIGHTDMVFCIVFSKKLNWFASGSQDQTIRCWKQKQQEWICTIQQQHTDDVVCLVINNDENQLISGSKDNTLVVWKLDCQLNSLEYHYTMENRHTDTVYSISLNQCESGLVSCSEDKSIILWTKNKNDKWTYQHHIINDDTGYRICFIDNNQIAWQQKTKGITHIFQIQNGKLTPQSNIELNRETYDIWLFPTIVNNFKQVIIQKHNQYIYILQRKKNGGLFLSCEPLECGNQLIYGTLTNNGEFLIIWKFITKEIKVYEIQYQ